MNGQIGIVNPTFDALSTSCSLALVHCAILRYIGTERKAIPTCSRDGQGEVEAAFTLFECTEEPSVTLLWTTMLLKFRIMTMLADVLHHMLIMILTLIGGTYIGKMLVLTASPLFFCHTSN